MNTSVAALAPKGKYVSTAGSIKTRVAIAVGCHIPGLTAFWGKVFQEFDTELDESLFSTLQQ